MEQSKIEKALMELLPSEKYANSDWDIIISDKEVICINCYYSVAPKEYALIFPIIDNSIHCKRFAIRTMDTINNRTMQAMQAYYKNYIDMFFDDVISL